MKAEHNFLQMDMSKPVVCILCGKSPDEALDICPKAVIEKNRMHKGGNIRQHASQEKRNVRT